MTEIFDLIARLPEQGLSSVLSEQNAQQSLATADRGYVIETGRVAMEGAADALMRSPEIAEKYLGVGQSAAGRGEEYRLTLGARLKDRLRS